MRLNRKNLDVAKLTKELRQATGREVYLGVSLPADESLPAEISVTDASGNPVQVDENIVREVYSKHVVTATPAPTVRQRIQTAKNIEELKTVLLDVLAPPES